MRWEDERYVRLYTRDTIEWDMLPWQSRALFPLLLRKVDRSGIIELGKHGTKGLARMIDIPLEVAEEGLAGLRDDGCVVLSGTQLVVKNFIEAQEATASDAARAKIYRERKRTEALEGTSRNVTEPSQNVTQPSRVVTDRHATTESSLLAVPNQPNQPNQTVPESDARARVDDFQQPDDSPYSTRERAVVLMRAWVTAGLPENGNAQEMAQLAKAIDTSASMAADANRSFPSDGEILTQMHALMQALKASGKTPYYQPSRMIKYLPNAIESAREAGNGQARASPPTRLGRDLGEMMRLKLASE